MAKLSHEAEEFYTPHFKAMSFILVLSTTVPIDVLKFLINWIPGIDLINVPVSIAGLGGLGLYFFIKLGSRYLGGKKSGRKWAIVLVTFLVGLIPILDGIVP